MHPDSPPNIVKAVRIRGDLDVRLLAEAQRRIIIRHEALWTNITTLGDMPIRNIAEAGKPTLPHTDLSQVSPQNRSEEIQALVDAEVRSPFDLSRDLLLRVTLLTSTAEEHLLILTFHRSVYDEASWGVYYRELSSIYDSMLCAAECRPPCKAGPECRQQQKITRPHAPGTA